MLSLTRACLSASFGHGRSDAALLAVPLVPAAAVLDVTVATVESARQTLRSATSWLRRTVGQAALRVARACDVVPTATRLEVRLARLTLPLVSAPSTIALPNAVVPSETLPVLPMPSAAQVTVESAPALIDYRAAVAEHGSVRAAARALGIAESTLRRRLKS